MTLPALVNAPTGEPAARLDLYAAYLAALTGRGAGNSSFRSAARAFLRRWPDPAEWAAEPLSVRLSAGAGLRPFLNFLMLGGFLRPGFDYLLERKLPSVLREAAHHQIGGELKRFLAAAGELGFAERIAEAMASQVAMRLLIQTGRPLDRLTEADLAEFNAAIGHREAMSGRSLRHYRIALHGTRTVLYHLGAPVSAAVKHTAHLRWSWEHHFTDTSIGVGRSMVAYLECAAGTRTRSTVLGIAGQLAHFTRFIAAADPALTSLAQLDRQRHIEPYLAAVAAARNPRSGAALSASERRSGDPDRRPDDRRHHRMGLGRSPNPPADLPQGHSAAAAGAAPLPARRPGPGPRRRPAGLPEPAPRRRAAAAAGHRDADR